MDMPPRFTPGYKEESSEPNEPKMHFHKEVIDAGRAYAHAQRILSAALELGVGTQDDMQRVLSEKRTLIEQAIAKHVIGMVPAAEMNEQVERAIKIGSRQHTTLGGGSLGAVAI